MRVSHESSSSAVAVKTTGRGRSLEGCSTCRRRHIKCDERQPSCQVCESQGIICEGYRVTLAFDASSSQRSQCRRPLFSLKLRQQMTEILTTTVAPEKVDSYLSRVDDECDKIDNITYSNFSTELGPFGAFCLAKESAVDEAQQPTHAHASLRSPPEPTGSTDPASDIYGILADDALMECLFWDFDMPAGYKNGDFSIANSSPPTEFEPHGNIQTSHHACTSNTVQSPLMTLAPSLAHPYAPALISHYRDVVIHSFSPVLSNKTPWHILHLPMAMETLAQLNMGEFAASARMAVFYSILATSALSLLRASPEGYSPGWQSQADAFCAQAQGHFKMSLRLIQSGEQKVGYKEMLIAFLCMSTLWAYKGDEKQVERCLLDCEHWITMRGIPKPHKSRKVRLLHHCYLCTRTIYESTSVCRKPVFPANNPSGRFFHRQKWANRFEQRMDERKDGPIVENDMHFEIPGKWDSSMYPEIYGIPEPLLFSLAHVTRLANERQISNSNNCEDALGLKEFLERARSLERYISRWQPPTFISQSQHTATLERNIQAPHDFIISHMIIAMHKALLIYFYRRIYDADALMLQGHVEHIREILTECSRFDIPAIYHAGSFVWIAFIAACEALNPATQSWFSSWFDTCTAKGGLQFFQVIKTTAQEVWMKNKQGICAGWPDILLLEIKQNLFYI
ncbi:hypothetical protein N7456_002623 [Penicillium angulare]|uniref:Zn(2)-C6 fungal-type domain-containing protein n=1 Tax=Penicillium angulare TaxID=116970 RepID=A0A9W9KP69_9EURO|nr:hypothetical protein N7456_002623 [Penicillium angulare]